MAFGKKSLVNSKPIATSFVIYRPDNGQTLMSCTDRIQAQQHLQSLSARMGMELKIKEIRPI